jgi:2-polyprenyl-3-methyl-5-hydroxy-6-metoxy-1,4-benzoquinol methylase
LETRYGTYSWFEQHFSAAREDPWLNNWRGIEIGRYDIVENIIKGVLENETFKNNKISILDIGCSTGHFTNTLSKTCENIVGVDISDTAIKIAREKYPKIVFRSGNFQNIDIPGNTVSIAVCMEMLYYVEDELKDDFMEKILTTLVADGCLILTTQLGEKPYFTDDGIIKFISDKFIITHVVYYGSKSYSKIENYFFRIYSRNVKLEHLIKGDGDSGVEDPQKKIGIERYLRFINKFKVMTELLKVNRCIENVVKMIMHLRFPATIMNRVADRCKLDRTHIIVVARKR